MSIWLGSLQRQDEAYYVALQEQTGSPGGNDPGYWGRSHNSAGDRVAPMPTDDEWENALDELAAASLQAGVGVASSFPAHAHDDRYATNTHGHTSKTVD